MIVQEKVQRSSPFQNVFVRLLSSKQHGLVILQRSVVLSFVSKGMDSWTFGGNVNGENRKGAANVQVYHFRSRVARWLVFWEEC